MYATDNVDPFREADRGHRKVEAVITDFGAIREPEN